MIVVAGSVRVKPDARERALDAAREMVAASRAEPGCTAYVYAIDLDDEHVVHIFEEWESEEAMAAHTATPHMARFASTIAAVVDGEASFTRYEASDKRDLFG